ncbi:hypothetical protein Ndes2526A_g00550 [Nannochloris sp. 'desiccata']
MSLVSWADRQPANNTLSEKMQGNKWNIWLPIALIIGCLAIFHFLHSGNYLNGSSKAPSHRKEQQYVELMQHKQGTQWLKRCTDELLTDGWQPRNLSRPLYILLLGLEGSGHHMTHQALDDYTNSTQRYTPEVYNWDNETAPYTFTTASELKASLLKQDWFHPNTRSVVLDGQNSCPSGSNGVIRSPYRCPDPFLWLELENQGLLDIRFVFLSRPFGDSVFSALRRKFTQSVDMQLRLEEFSASYLTSALHALPCSHTYILPYATAKDHSRSLMKFLELKGRANFRELSKTSGSPLGEAWVDLCPFADTEQECTEQVLEKINNFERSHGLQWDWLN